MRAALALAATLLVAIALAVVGLDASGAARPPAHTVTAAAGGSICTDPYGVTTAVITRQNPSKNPLVFGVPARVVVRDVPEVHELAAALCALPPLPPGPHFCPLDLGVRDHIVFLAGTDVRARVVIDLGGCGEVRGLGRTRWTELTPGFGQILATALGRPHATWGEIAGTLRS